EVIDQCLPDNCLDTVQLYFPDPWHKKRHHKRRLVQTGFAEKIARILKPGGRWLLATDWANYAEHMLEVLNPHPAFENRSKSGDYVARPAERAETRFERRGLDRGHGVWDLAFSKR
ncbi:MAG: tRNA (guanine(46)-N(7))-methyltransferase TrmB, partial [Nevskiales bacterium]